MTIDNHKKTSFWSSNTIKFMLEICGFIILVVQLYMLNDELKQSNAATRVQIRSAISNDLLTVSMAFANKEISQAFSKPIYTLSSTECNQLYGFSRGMFRSWENQFYQYKQGYFDENEYHGALKTWSHILKFDIFRLLWDYQKNEYSNDFKVVLSNEAEKADKSPNIPISKLELPKKDGNISLCHRYQQGSFSNNMQ